MKLTIIKTENTDPYENLAAEEYMTFHAEEDEVILFLWQNAHTVVIGRNQNPWKECNVERIKQDGISLARRMSGGGAVYHDLGNLNFTFAARDGLFDIQKQTEIILHACRLLGINAEKTGRNDLTVQEKKFSGHAYYSSNGFNYHHGTIMIDVVPEDMTKYLRVSESKLRSKGVDSVRSRVINLIDVIPAERLAEICRTADTGADSGTGTEAGKTAAVAAAMKNALITASEKTYGTASSPKQLPEIPAELIEKYSSEEWRLGTRIPFERDIEHRFDWGGLEIQLEMRGEYIADVKMYSDALETEVFTVLEDLLRGCRYDAGEILGLRIPHGVSATAYEILELIASSIDDE